MSASFPTSIKTWTDKQDNIDDVFAGDVNGVYTEIIAVETELMQVGYKKSARVATTENGTLATAFANGQTVDGVVLATGDSILLKDQTNGAENGIYTVNASGAPTRRNDANAAAHMVPGLMVYVREGATNAKGTWKLTTTATITLGTTALAFENEVASHQAEIVSKNIYTTRSAGVIGEQVITVGFKPKTIIVNAALAGEVYESIGYYSDQGGQSSIYTKTSTNKDGSGVTVVMITDASAFEFGATIINITDTGFSLNWGLVGTKTGTVVLSITAMTH